MDKPTDPAALRDALATVRRQMARPTASPAASLEYEAYTEACEPVAREFVRLLDAGELVRVRGLEWNYSECSPDSVIARECVGMAFMLTPFGPGNVTEWRDGRFTWFLDPLTDPEPCDSLDDGKAKVESLYRNTVAAALEPLFAKEVGK